MVSEQSLKEVWRYIKRHQNPADGMEDNYVSQISRETGLTRKTVQGAVECLEDMGLIRRNRRRGKALISLDVGLRPDREDDLDPGGGRWDEQKKAWP